MTIKKCEWCGGEHNVKPADIRRGWGRFCSKSCKAKAQEKRTGQHAAHQRSLNDDELGHPFAAGYFGHGQE